MNLFIISTVCIISCTSFNNEVLPDVIIGSYVNNNFIGFETKTNIYVIQTSEEINVFEFDFDLYEFILSDGSDLLLIHDDISYTIRVSGQSDVTLDAVGIITLTKGDDFSDSLEEFVNRTSNAIIGNCWSGGPGATSCRVNIKNTNTNVTCHNSFYACCNRDITGICVKY